MPACLRLPCRKGSLGEKVELLNTHFGRNEVFETGLQGLGRLTWCVHHHCKACTAVQHVVDALVVGAGSSPGHHDVLEESTNTNLNIWDLSQPSTSIPWSAALLARQVLWPRSAHHFLPPRSPASRKARARAEPGHFRRKTKVGGNWGKRPPGLGLVTLEA